MEVLNTIANAVHWVAQNAPWAAVLAAGILSPILLAIKKKFKVQSEKVMICLVAFAGLVVAGGNYLLHVPTQNPTIIALQGLAVAFMTQPFYFFIVKPLSIAVTEQLAKAAAFDEQVKSAANPLPETAPEFSQ